MDNVIWLIIVSAVVIALAGMVLFIASSGIGDIDEAVEGFLEMESDPEGADVNTDFYPKISHNDHVDRGLSYG